MQPDAEPKWTCSISLTGYKLALDANGCWKMDKVPIEIRSILSEIEKALNAKLYYLAIAVALSVPDICSSLEFDPDNPKRASGDTYSAWCNVSMRGAFKNLDGWDLYFLRCGVLHFGHFGHKKAKFNRVIFIGPESQIKGHDVIMFVSPGVNIGLMGAEDTSVGRKILQLEVVPFCETIMKAAREWSIAKATDHFVQRNLPRLVRYRPDGLPPFSIGVPTIA